MALAKAVLERAGAPRQIVFGLTTQQHVLCRRAPCTRRGQLGERADQVSGLSGAIARISRVSGLRSAKAARPAKVGAVRRPASPRAPAARVLRQDAECFRDSYGFGCSRCRGECSLNLCGKFRARRRRTDFHLSWNVWRPRRKTFNGDGFAGRFLCPISARRIRHLHAAADWARPLLLIPSSVPSWVSDVCQTWP
jgi:hypothetical protein